jgi:hypothetical protein
MSSGGRHKPNYYEIIALEWDEALCSICRATAVPLINPKSQEKDDIGDKRVF